MFSISKKFKKHGISAEENQDRRPYFPSSKSSKQELFNIQKTWYFMLNKILSQIKFLNHKKTVFLISQKLKTRTFS